MKQTKMTPLKGIVLLLLLVTVLGIAAGCNKTGSITEVPSEEEYSYINPDEAKAETDAGFVIDGILDEEAYQKNNWLYLHNDDGGNDVNIAMTSHFGEKGIYFVFDVTESVPIYVNLERPSYMNSCIEIYLSAPHVTSMRENDVFEIDLLPTGDMLFKRSNGRDGYSNVATTNDIMACLGTATKGGAVNTADCYGYSMELFIPWDYLKWLKMDVEAIQNGYVYINPAHITSYNLNGTDTGIDRYWYHYVQQNGVSFSNVSRHFRFNGQGVMGSVPVTLQQGTHYTLSGASAVIPGMNAIVTVQPDEGYALTSIMLNGQEQIEHISFNEDGSVTLTIPGTKDGATVSAKAEAVTEGTKTLGGKIVLNNISKDGLDGLLLTYIGPKGEKPLTPEADGTFALKDLEQGYYTLKAEKAGYTSVSRSIYLNQDFYTELVLEYDFFRVTLGNAWILDGQNDGVLYKKDGEGQVLSNTSYNSFTFRANLKYDLNLAELGTADSYTQQRSGMQIRFSNGKSWHIHMLKEKGKYILQYAKISGNNSVTGWQTIHTLSAGQIGRYTGKDGIRLSVARQGNYAAIWLDDELIKIETLDTQYQNCSAQLGLESWASNRELLKVPFSIQSQSVLNLRDLPILDDSKPYYDDFTFRATLKFNPRVAELGTGDEYTQQRAGMQIRFRDGKSWHIDLLQEKGNYILQYAKISGENSLTNWQTVHTLDEEQIQRYTGQSGIELCVMRQGNYAAIWLDDALIKIEILDEKYDDLSAQLALETWAYKQGILDIPFRIENHATVDVKGSPFLTHAKTWNISGQYEGKLYKQGTEGVYTVLESVIVTNDVATVATDLSPDTKDYSLAYLFKFSNGEQFRVRLHHTDKDGVYRIQSMNGSTVVPEWKVGYALTEEQAAKVMSEGIEFRVLLSGTNADVYLDGQVVCTYDLSKNLASGQPSGVDKATAKVGFSLDGNYGLTTELPFKLADISKDVKIYVTDVANGIITASKESCTIGETVTLTIAGNPGCYYNEICINGEKIDPAWDGTYSYKATENIYIVTGSFAPGDFRENQESAWNVLKQNQNLLYMQAHTEGDSGWLNAEHHANDLSATVRDAAPDAKNFAMIYHFDFSNGETLRLRLHHTDSDGKYRIQVMDHSTVSEEWKSHYTLTDAEEALVQGDGIKFRTWIDGTNAVVYLDGNPVCTIDLSKVLSTGSASGVEKAAVQIKIKMDGNLNQAMEIPFKLTDTGKQVLVNIESLSNGKVTTAEASYQVGDTVVLTITPDAGYSQKLYINGEPLLLDWKTNTYSFTATETVYNITGTFEPSLNITPKDLKRWDTANQAHGILNAYYPNHSDAWLTEIQDEYRSISVMAKNYLPGEDGTGVEGFAVNLGFKLSNGKEYIFRIIKEKGKYYHQRFGINGNDWKKTELDASAIEALCDDGVNFKLERTSAGTLTLSINGVVYDNYTMEGVTAQTKVTTAIIGHYGNKGEKIALPFVLKTPADTVDANLNIAETVNGTVTAGQENYQVGDTVILTVTPNAGYALKSLVVQKDGQPVEIGKNYSFVIEDGVYTVEAEFIASMFKIVSGNWDLSNQFDGFLTITAQKDGTTVLTNANSYKEVSVTVKDHTPSKNTDGSLKQGNFSMQISFIFDNGKEYQVRMHNTDKDGNYKLQNMGGTNSLTGWKWQADLTTAQKQKLLEGDGVEFAVKLVGSDAELYVDGRKMAAVALGAEYAGKTAQIKLCMNGNKGVQNLEIPFTLQ